MHLCAVHRPYSCTQRSWQHLRACLLTSEQAVSSQSVFRLIESPPPHYACPWVGASLLSPRSKTATSACPVACLCRCMVSGFLCHALFPSSSAPVRNGFTSPAYCHLFSVYLLDCITSIPLLSFPCSFMREEMSPMYSIPHLEPQVPVEPSHHCVWSTALLPCLWTCPASSWGNVHPARLRPVECLHKCCARWRERVKWHAALLEGLN